MYLTMYNGDQVWSSRPLKQLNGYQRLALRWPFMVPRLERYGAVFCGVVAVSLIVAGIAAGNMRNGFHGRFDGAVWGMGALIFFAVVFVLPLMHGILKQELSDMRDHEQFRFPEAQCTPGFTALMLFDRCLPAPHPHRPPEVEMVLNRWVREYFDLDQQYLEFMADASKTELERLRYQMRAYEHAFERFKMQPLRFPDDFGQVCGYELSIMAFELESSLMDEIETARLTIERVQHDATQMEDQLQRLRLRLSDLD